MTPPSPTQTSSPSKQPARSRAEAAPRSHQSSAYPYSHRTSTCPGPPQRPAWRSSSFAALGFFGTPQINKHSCLLLRFGEYWWRQHRHLRWCGHCEEACRWGHPDPHPSSHSKPSHQIPSPTPPPASSTSAPWQCPDVHFCRVAACGSSWREELNGAWRRWWRWRRWPA